MSKEETILVAAIVFGGLLLWLFIHRERPLRFRAKAALTGVEREFFFRLRDALPSCQVCPQLAVSALIEPAGIGAARQRALECIAGQRVGYAVFDGDMQLIAVVELDHHSRTTRRDATRDQYFSSAGIRTVRFKAKCLPSELNIRKHIFARAEPGGRSHYDYDKGEREAGIEFKPTSNVTLSLSGSFVQSNPTLDTDLRAQSPFAHNPGIFGQR